MLLFAFSTALTGTGFLVQGVPLFVAYLPFAAVLVALPCRRGTRGHAAALIAGHFLWPALIGGWGLIQLGFAPLGVVAGGVAAMLLVSTATAWLGIGLSTLVLAALPFFPANPLLITGSILPGAGLWGMATLPLWLILIEWNDRLWVRGSLLAATLILPRLLFPWVDTQDSAASSRTDRLTYTEIDISGDITLTERGHWARIAARLGNGDTVILGENIFAHDNHAATYWWCRTVRARGITALIGVLGPTGLGEVWRFDSGTCPKPRPVYRARLGIPVVNDGWWPQGVKINQDVRAEEAFPEPHWLICFETFSLWRWITVGMDVAMQDDTRSAVILTNDRWTKPIPTAVLRRKVTGQFSVLFGVQVLHADQRKTVLMQKTNP